MNCLRCKCIISDKVNEYSLSKFGFSLCRNCQEWYLSENKEISINEKRLFLQLITLIPNHKYLIPEYEPLIDYFGKERTEVKKNNIDSFSYILEDFNGKKHIIENSFKLENFATFKFGNNDYRVINVNEGESLFCTNGMNIFCKQLPILNTNHLTVYEKDSKIIEFEEEIISFFDKRNIRIIPNTLNEKYFSELLLNQLSKYFFIEREIIGTHFSGKKMRIDAILRPKDNSEWRNKELAIGLEIKSPLMEEVNNRRDTDILAQCLDYSFCKYEGIKDIIIVICPLLPSLKRNDKLIRFLSRYNIGHLDFTGGTISMSLAGQQFWSERYIPSILKKSLFKTKYGNRGVK